MPYVFAHALEVDLDLESSGTWEDLDDGSRLYGRTFAACGVTTGAERQSKTSTKAAER